MKHRGILLCVVCIMLLCGCADTISDDENARSVGKEKMFVSEFDEGASEEGISNPFFVPNNMQDAYYISLFTFSEEDLPNEVKLLVTEVAQYTNGNLYELKINCDNEVSGRDYYGWDRFRLGYFYVTKDTIYLLKNRETLNALPTEEEIITQSTIVCQEESMKIRDAEEDGVGEYIEVNGNQCKYTFYNSLTETGFYESFIWEKGVGLINYRSGFGAMKNAIDLEIIRG